MTEVAIFGIINSAVNRCRVIFRYPNGPLSTQMRRPMRKTQVQMMVLSIAYSSSEETKSRFADAARIPIVMIPWCNGADLWKIQAL